MYARKIRMDNHETLLVKMDHEEEFSRKYMTMYM